MAVHLEGRSSSVLDMTGLAQKGGTVISHIRLSANKETTGAVRVDPGQADLAILCDVVAAAHPNALSCLRPGHTHAIINEYLAPTAEFTRNPDAPLDAQHLLSQLKTTAGENQVRSFNAHQAATLLFGDSLLSNMLLMGMAWQQGSMPVSSAAVEQAIRLNGVAIQANLDAFHLGRVLAHDEKALASLLAPAAQVVTLQRRETLEQIMQRCTSSLEQYQNAAYAQRFTNTINALRDAEQKLRPGQRPALTEKAARSLYKLMAYKDEYEVARLFSSPAFRQDLEQQFEGDFSLRFHFAPPLLARRDPTTGRPRKITLGPRTATLLRWMAKGKGLRNTVLDPFGYTHERRMERRFWREYQNLLNNLSKNLDQANYATALELAELPQQLRGFGPVKMESAKKYEARFAELSQQLKNTGPEIQAVPA
jgi:indolepyruvate ferredoxin oxidoreductase